MPVATKPSTVDSAATQGTPSSSFSSGVANDLQQRCYTIETGLNDLKNVLKTLTTTCAILEKSAEKLGSDMMEIRGILASKDSPKAGTNLSVSQELSSISAVERVCDASSSSKSDTPIHQIINASVHASNVGAGLSGARNVTQSAPSLIQPGANITPVGRMSVSSVVVPPAEPARPAASSSSQPDTPARPVVPTSSGITNAGGTVRVKREKDDLIHGLSTSTPSQTLPPRRARKQGLGFTRSIPLSGSTDDIETPISGARTPLTSGDLRDDSVARETLNWPKVAQHNLLKQVHFGAELSSAPAAIAEVRAPVEQVETTDADSLPTPAPRMELRIRIRNPTNNAPGRIENISGMTVRIPKTALDKITSAMPSSTSVTAPSSQVSALRAAATHSEPARSSKAGSSAAMPKPKRPVGRPRKRRRTTSTSKKVKTEDIEASLATDAPILRMLPESSTGLRETSGTPVSAVPAPREDRSMNKFASLSKALEQCKDAFSNYLAAASRESTTSASSTRAPPSKKRAPAQKRLASSSVPSAATFSPKIEFQDFPVYPSALSVPSPRGSSPSAAATIVTSTTPVVSLLTSRISPPFLVPSNAPLINPVPPSESTAKTASRPRRQRGARLAELDREAEERMRVRREKRDKTRWDPGSGRRVVVPTSAIGDEGHSQMAPGVEELIRADVPREATPISKSLMQGAGAGEKEERAVVIVKEEEEEMEW